MNEYRGIAEDYRAIDAAILRDRIAYLADLARQDESSSELVVVTDDDFIDVPDYRPPRTVTTTSVPEYRERRVDKFVLALRVLGMVAVVGAVVGIGYLVIALVTAVTTAVTTALPTLLGIAGIVALVLLLASLGGRGGGTFSGTFSGRMH